MEKEKEEEKEIEVTGWKILDREYTLVSYTAKGDWCKPCERIKPYLAELEKVGKLTKTDTTVINAKYRPTGMKVPHFKCIDKDGKTIYEIQTSDKDTFGIIFNFL